MQNKYLVKIAQANTEVNVDGKPFKAALATATKAKLAELPAQALGGAAGAYVGAKLIKNPVKFHLSGRLGKAKFLTAGGVTGGVLGAFAGQELAGFGGSLASIYRDTKKQQRHQDV